MVKTEKTNAGSPLILIAEDSDSNYMLFRVLLKNDYLLIHAKNGREAIQFFVHYQPQLILMDIKMPEIDGYEATAEIRKLSASVPIIAITAYAFPEDEERILSSGFNAYLSKPVNSKELKNKIRELLKSCK